MASAPLFDVYEVCPWMTWKELWGERGDFVGNQRVERDSAMRKSAARWQAARE
jgi:hypothetical protein